MPDLRKKLNLKDQDPLLILNLPESFQTVLGELSHQKIVTSEGKAIEADFLLVFVQTLRDVQRAAELVTSKTQGDAVVWMAYPKQTAKKYNCEFHRDTGWKSLEEIGLRGVRQVAIDLDWSAIRFRRLKFIKQSLSIPPSVS